MKTNYIRIWINKLKHRIFNPVARNVFWRIDRKDRLILFGRGCIPGYEPGMEYFDEPPWISHTFQQVVIGKGIRDIHPTALLGIDLDDVILENEGRRGDGLEINEAGVYNHFKKELLIGRNQERVVIPDGTVDINPFAFAYHQKVREIECPSSLERIGVSAFEGCKKLRYIYRIPAEAKIGVKALKGTSGVRVYYDRNPAQRNLWEMAPRNALTDFGRGFLMNGEFLFFASETERNIDPTKFYRCKNLIDIKGGDDFLIGLRSDGTVIYEETDPFSGVFDYYGGPFRFEQQSGFERLKGWNHIREIAATGNVAAGLCEDGTVFCTAEEDENQPVKGIKDAISIEVKDNRIFAVMSDWSLVPVVRYECLKEGETSHVRGDIYL